MRETLQDDPFGLTIGEIEAKLVPLWSAARFVEPVPFADPELPKVVHGDSDDLPVLATGLAMLANPLLGPIERKFNFYPYVSNKGGGDSTRPRRSDTDARCRGAWPPRPSASALPKRAG